MQDRLNFFEPWERPANHENQLTRALLVVLRYCPIAHQAWLSLVDAAASSPLNPNLPGLALHSLHRPTFDTQRAHILRGESQPETNEPIKGLSVLCAADASYEVQGAVLESDRGQVLDGIIRYGDDCVIVLESKLHESADDRQARNINLHGQPIQFDDFVRKISWRDVLDSFMDLAEPERRLVVPSLDVLNDFLAFVDKPTCHKIRPRSTRLTLRRGLPSRVWPSDWCNSLSEVLKMISDMLSGNIQLVRPIAIRIDVCTKRQLAALAVAADEPVTDPVKTSQRSPRASTIDMEPGTAFWHPETPKAVLKTLADAIAKRARIPTSRPSYAHRARRNSLEQARSFYARPEAVERILKLQNEGWIVRPNFHFGFMATGYSWTDATMPVAEYLQYWLERIDDARQIERRDWDQYWRNLVNEKIAQPEDRERFDRDFTNTERASATPRPGIECRFDSASTGFLKLSAKIASIRNRSTPRSPLRGHSLPMWPRSNVRNCQQRTSQDRSNGSNSFGAD